MAAGPKPESVPLGLLELLEPPQLAAKSIIAKKPIFPMSVPFFWPPTLLAARAEGLPRRPTPPPFPSPHFCAPRSRLLSLSRLELRCALVLGELDDVSVRIACGGGAFP